MAGYPDNKNKVLNEWYQLFKQKNNNGSRIHKHWKNIETLGLPDLKSNNWKYTALEELLTYNFEFSKNVEFNEFQYKKLGLSIDSYRLIFINDKFSPELSDKNIDPWIMKINRNPNRYELSNPIQPEMFLYLTECLSDATIHITLPEQKITKKPLYLLYINAGSDAENKLITSHYYHYLEIGSYSNACIIEHFVSVNKNAHFTGARMSIKIGNNAKLHHIKLVCENHESYHIAHNDLNIGQYAHADSNIFAILGPKLTRHQTSAQINNSEASLSLNSLILLSKKNIGDIRTYLEHNNQEYAISRQLHKIIACDCSTGIFNGLIKVNPNSMKTDGKMTNNNLLLHQDANISSTPKLEIYSDDVKCSHGSTIGQINAEHLFYLSTRGILKKDALKMLIYAFSVEIIESINNPIIQDTILTRINKALSGITT